MRVTRSVFYLLLFLAPSYQSVADSKVVIGWVESAMLHTHDIALKAKIDTGADKTSLHATNLKIFRKMGKDWVRFELEDEREHVHTIERPVARYTSIKRRGVTSQERPVVLFKICLDSKLREVEVNLTNRDRYNYKLLIGRSYLEGLFLVDSDRMYTAKPTCKS